MERYGRARLVPDDMCFERLIVQAKTLGICNTYRFSTAPVVTLTRLSVRLFVHSLFFFYSFHGDVFVIRFVAFVPTADNTVCVRIYIQSHVLRMYLLTGTLILLDRSALYN